MPMKKTSYIISLGGVIASLCLLMMFATALFPPFSIVVPMFTGMLIAVISIETERKWAAVTYAAVSVLCLFMTPSYESTFLFIFFFGYYPILKGILDKIRPFLLRWTAKLVCFNASIVSCYWLITNLFGVYDMWSDFDFFGKYLIPGLLVMANVMFLLYDYTLGSMIIMYTKWLKPTFLPNYSKK